MRSVGGGLSAGVAAGMPLTTGARFSKALVTADPTTCPASLQDFGVGQDHQAFVTNGATRIVQCLLFGNSSALPSARDGSFVKRLIAYSLQTLLSLETAGG